MIKGCSVLVIGFFLLLSIPICIGIGGGVFGLLIGLIGGAVGVVFGIIGAVIGVIVEVFSGITHLLFGWGHHHSFHPWHWHFNGLIILSLIALIFVVATRTKK
jgi:hypothetical protein